MKVLINHAKHAPMIELEDVDTVVRHRAYVQIIKGNQSWTYPWRVVDSLKVEDVGV